MALDVSTLTFAGGLVTFASGLFLLLTWWQDRTARAALWWAAANCGAGIGITSLAFHAALPPYVSIVLGPLILDLCAGLAWVAARMFNRGSLRLYPTLAVVGAAIASIALVGGLVGGGLAAALEAGTSGCLYAAAAVEFWLARDEKLRGRWPMMGVLSLQAIALLLAAADFASSEIFLPTPSMNWLGIIHFVGLVYAVGSAICLVTMLNERSEARHKAEALIDPLTGLPNRRAFMDSVTRMFERSAREEVSIALLTFDLDRFKAINDTFGHPTGDHVLRIFAEILSRALRPADVASRLGGEEFSVALPRCGMEAALAIAERIRGTFEDDARFVNGHRVGATVSVGVAVAGAPPTSLDDLIASADGALYRAKNLGRNRVVRAENRRREPSAGNVVRIA